MVYFIATIIISIVSVILTVAIVFQQSKSSGLSGAIGGGSDTYFSKNKNRTREGKLVKITTIAAIVFFIAAIVLNVGLFTQL
ncbi:MAG: preprotein translocase subunit SecG [Parasporobacterium sp.]|nr:preprotein translocase subunit SecG [Parasporobacterium sp.]